MCYGLADATIPMGYRLMVWYRFTTIFFNIIYERNGCDVMCMSISENDRIGFNIGGAAILQQMHLLLYWRYSGEGIMSSCCGRLYKLFFYVI